MSDRPSPSESARLLRQRVEMGTGEIFLDGLTRREALELVARARAAFPSSRGPGSPSGAAPGDVEPGLPSRAESGGRSSAGPTGSRSPSPSERSSASEPAAANAAPPDPSEESPSHDDDAPLPDDYDALRELALGCTRCRLCEGRTQVVFSDGPRDARLMVVGEAPGANEDETGLPFVGAAGKYLDLLLATVGLSREESVYIANVLKCRPPGNRDPKPDEIETCSPYLRKQIDLVRPQALLAVGSFSGKLLTGREKSSLGRLRGEVHSYHGVRLVVTYHPAALLRNSRWTRAFWDDLQLLRSVLERQAESS